MGTVWRAKQRVLKSAVAVKVLSSYGMAEEAQQRFLAKARGVKFAGSVPNWQDSRSWMLPKLAVVDAADIIERRRRTRQLLFGTSRFGNHSGMTGVVNECRIRPTILTHWPRLTV